MVQPFVNEPLSNFAESEVKQQMEQALSQVNQQLGQEYPLVIGGTTVFTGRWIHSMNPSRLDEVIGKVAKASEKEAEQAMQAALKTFDTWRTVPAVERARYLLKAAALLRKRKFHFSSWMVLEAGKTWVEADADTAEAIDFMEFYAREMFRLSERQPLIEINGEDNELSYLPLGVGIILPPWNFPLAILAGMTTSAIVTGNTVILKPASTTTVIAAQFVQLLEEAGLPKGVVNFLPGSGGEIGDYLVKHPKTRFINFTGSRDVGVRINRLAADVSLGQIWLKRVIAELGGKDAIVVDSDADVEEAALGIVTSAFGFSGQKCSACSRAIIHQDVYDQVSRRVVELAKRLRVGDAQDPSTNVGPVIDQNAYEKIQEYIEIGKSEAKLLEGGGRPQGNGYYLQPTLFADVNPLSRIAQEEIFGPVLALIRADSFEQAIEIANNTEYGLTGSVYSRNRSHLSYAKSHFHVGNLYFNRKCTGAFVGVHPFGGFNMSGTDSKAGGRDYLQLFLQAKVISEKL